MPNACHVLDARPSRLRALSLPLATLAVLFVLFRALTPAAPAAPAGPTMDLEQLGTALGSGPLDGYLLTTMSGTTPEKIPLQVQSLVTHSDGTLILFEASGPVIDKLGAIAAGMSGSPVYATVGGVDYLVGALSYGDMFTRGGTGLATPIEYMTAIEDTYPVGPVGPIGAQTAATPRPGAYALRTPVETPSGVVRDVVIAKSVAAGRKLAAATDQPVVAPLGIIEIGGARPGSAAYERVAAKFARTGMLIKAASGDGTWTGTPAPSLTAGSPCAVLFSQGAIWVGAAGTVTYVDGDTAMLFGHPFGQFGAMESLLTGGYVEGAWPSSYEPYKLIAPRDVKGRCVQDRAWGVEAQIGGSASLFPVHTTVHFAGRTLDDTSSVEQWLFTSQAYPSLPADIASELTYRLADQAMLPGSATTTTTVVVSDATGTYTVTRHDLWSDAYDVTFDVGMDASTALETLAANPDGTLAAHIDSVTVAATVDQTQRSARIVGVDIPDGLKTGPNHVVISYYAYGSSTPQTLTATLVIPNGTALTGRLTISPGGLSDSDVVDPPVAGARADASAPPQTLAELVDSLNPAPHDSDLVIAYTSDGGDVVPLAGGDSAGTPVPIPSTAPVTISVTVPTDYVFSDRYSASPSSVDLTVRQRTVGYGGSAEVSGGVDSSTDVPVRIYRQDAGSDTPVLVDTVTAHAVQGMATFSAVVPGLRRNATVIAVASAGDGTLTGRAAVRVAVRALVRISGGAPLSIQVRPTTSGRVSLERKTGGRWVEFRSVRIVDGRGSVRLPKGAWTVRAKFSGSSVCAAGTSRPLTITLR